MKRVYSAIAVMTALTAAFTSATVEAKKKPREVWTVSRTSDPITGDSSCVVTAYDTVANMKYSRFGFLYPVVENNSKLGLLIGVSSGGQYRVPTGDVLWRIDSNPHRTLRAVDNPAVGANSVHTTPPFKTGNPETDKRIEEAMASSGKMVAAITATSTMATGDLAQEMLVEMIEGKTLLYRQANVAPAYGLPSSQTGRVGQYTSDEGQVPFKLDTSFHRGLKECGIVPAPKPIEPVAIESPSTEQGEQQEGIELETRGN